MRGKRDRPSGRAGSPWRYRWPDEFRDNVLARLLGLNEKRVALERLSGAVAEAGRDKSTRKSTGRRKGATKKPAQPQLLET
jgi:hypothetical protein